MFIERTVAENITIFLHEHHTIYCNVATPFRCLHWSSQSAWTEPLALPLARATRNDEHTSSSQIRHLAACSTPVLNLLREASASSRSNSHLRPVDPSCL